MPQLLPRPPYWPLTTLLLLAAAHAALSAPGPAVEPATPPFATLKAVLGKGPESKEMAALRKMLKGEPKASSYSGRYYHEWKGEGLSICFEKEVVTAVFLYADKADGFKAYRGEMPLGLHFTDTRADVEKKLGAPGKTGGGGVIPFWADYPAKGVGVTYISKDTKDRANRIHHLTITAPSGR